MKAEHVRDGALNVVAAKSDAGVRAVPIHPVIGPLVSSLLGHGDEYLIPTFATCWRSPTPTLSFTGSGVPSYRTWRN
jgi:hypothetical protein